MQLDLFGGEPVKQDAQKLTKKKSYPVAPPQETVELAEPIKDVIPIVNVPDEKQENEINSTFSPVLPPDEVLNEKLYYPISEVATMFQVNISLLRFWEKEFDILKPRKNRKGDRLFRPEDIRNLKMIHFLLKEKGYTIKGAKAFIKKGKKADIKFETIESLKKLKQMLIELRSGLI